LLSAKNSRKATEDEDHFLHLLYTLLRLAMHFFPISEFHLLVISHKRRTPHLDKRFRTPGGPRPTSHHRAHGTDSASSIHDTMLN
jgi:hypothetical protein